MHMKVSISKIIIVLTVIVILVSISGGVFVKTQEQNEAGNETNRPVSELPAKVPGQAFQAAGSPVGGAGDGGPSAATVSWKWFTTAGAVFIPWSNTMTWSYGGAGCLQPSAAGFWRASVNIPDGSILEELYFGYYNSAGSQASTANLYAYGYTGTSTQIATVNSSPGSTATGYSYSGVLISNVKVDNLSNAYTFTWSGSTTQQLCYIQVGYIPYNAFGVALPTILKQP
jgi:hypothetical protein